jgi:hypothetical protein
LSYALQVVPKPAAAVATPLHNGTNGQGHPYRVVEFVIETGNQSVYVGGEGITGDADGMEIDKEQQYDFEAPLSRGTPSNWDLRKIYYTGGAFKLIIIREVSNS